MAQVGRISGSLLQANLERNGIDLAFRNTTSDTQLLYFNVSSGKLGVNKGTTGYELDVAGTARSTNLLSNTNSVSNFTIENSTFSTLVGDINLNAGEAIVMAAMENGTIRIDDNIISTIETNANIDITPNGFGTTEIVNNLTTFGNIHSSGDINFDGTITLGNAAIDTVDFNADVNSDVIPDQRNTYNIGSSERKWDALYTNLLNGASVNVGALQVGNIQIDTRLGNTFYVAQNGNDSNGGDHIFAPFASISRALQAVDASIQGAVTIKVSPGEYQEELPLVVPNNVSIVGTDIRNCIIVPDTSSQSEDVFHLSDSSYISDLTIKNFYYNSVDNTGYAFRFAPNTVMSTRSPYIQNVTVITQGTPITVTASSTFSVNSQETHPRGITFNNDGTKMFIVGEIGDDVNEYTLSTGFDLSSIVTFVDSFAVTQCPNPTAVKFNADGTKMFVTGTNNDNVHQYALTTGFDVSSASFTQTLVTTVDSDNFGLDFKPDGTKMYITGNQNNKIYEYNLSSAFDISSATFNQDLTLTAIDFEPFGIEWSTDGTRLFIVGTRGNGVDEFAVGTPYDISTLTHIGFYSIGGNPSGIHISPDGTKMFIIGNQSDTVKSYDLSVSYRIKVPTDDPRGFAQGDAGRGAWIDGNELNSASTLATMLFHSCTFISPGADVINMTNGVRVEWLNSFTYFANRGLHAFNGSEGRVSQDGSTVKYGAELRSIGSANVYGTYGAVANGADTLMYLIQHNFAYIGAGSKTDNNQADVIQANETVELNNGKVHYVSTDQLGNFRVGENFFINLEDGTTSINIDTLDVDALSGLAINSSSQTTIIKGDIVTTGNIDIQDNNIISLSGDLNIAGGTNIVNFSDNTLITNNLIIRDNFSFGGTLNVSGDQEADSLDFNVNFEQNFNPHQTLVHDLGTVTKKWSNVYLGKMQAGNITSNDNYITSDESNANLELRANGTGVLSVPSNNVRIDNNLTIVKETTLKDSIVTYEYGSNLIDNGSFPTDVSSWTPSGGGTISSAGGNLRIDAIGSAQNASQVVTAVESGKTYDFTTTFKSAVNSNAFYLRIFESGVGTLFEWNESSGLINDQVLTASITPNSTTISIIFRVVDNTVEWDDVTLIEDIGLVETITPVQVNVTGNTTQTSNTTQVGNITQTGNTVITGNLNISDEYTAASFKFNDNVLNVYREDLRLNPDDPYGALSLPQIVSAMQGAGATADDYAGQTEKNLINFLANGTSAPYANSYIDVNSSGTTTSSDSLAWLQYVANGTTSNTAINEFIAPIVEQLLEDEFANPGKYNSTIFLGDYFRANFLLKANGTGKVSFPANDVRITNNLFASSIIANDINVTQDLDINDIVITDSIIQIDDNFITTSISNADLELRATQDVSVPVNNVIVENILTVNRNTDINDLTVLGNITQTGNRNQTGNLNIIGNVTVTSTNIDSEIQFDDILFNDNTITSNDSNADLELRANGTGILSVPSNDVYVINNVLIGTINSNSINTTLAIAAEELELSSDIKLYDNVITTTASNSNLELRSFNADILLENLRFNNDTIQTTTLDINLIPAQNLIIAATGAIKIPVGTTAQRQIADNRIRFNNTNNVFEASSNSNTLSFGGVYSSDRRTSMLAHPANNTINFAVNQTGVGSVNAAGLNINGLTVDDISVQLNAITTTLSNSDLDLRANGTGKLNMYSTNFTGNIIQNTHAGTLDIVHTGYGKAKFSTAGAVALPSGTTAERIPSPELGTTRWNTENTILETWDGNTYISAAGNAATISTEEMEDLMLEYTLIFG